MRVEKYKIKTKRIKKKQSKRKKISPVIKLAEKSDSRRVMISKPLWNLLKVRFIFTFLLCSNRINGTRLDLALCSAFQRKSLKTYLIYSSKFTHYLQKSLWRQISIKKTTNTMIIKRFIVAKRFLNLRSKKIIIIFKWHIKFIKCRCKCRFVKPQSLKWHQ